MQCYYGEIQIFGFQFAPANWAFCDGSLMSIAQNNALFVLLSTTYGGDGQNTFAVPDLRARNPVGVGQGPGLSPYSIGSVFGAESVTLTSNQMPAHTHVGGLPIATGPGQNRAAEPQAGRVLAAPVQTRAFRADTATGQLSGAALTAFGGSQPHENRQPYLGMNYCIAIQGTEFPTRN